LGVKDFYINLKKHNLENYLIANQDIKIINLYRENQLRRLISCLFLDQTGVVAKRKSEKEQEVKKKKKLFISIEQLIPSLKKYEEEVAGQFEIVQQVVPRRVMTIKYEDYFQSSATINQHNQLISQFLEVSPFSFPSNMEKILSSRWEDNVENDQDVRLALENTEYAKYLD